MIVELKDMVCPKHGERLNFRAIGISITQYTEKHKMSDEDWERYKNFKHDQIFRLNPSANGIFCCPKCAYAKR